MFLGVECNKLKCNSLVGTTNVFCSEYGRFSSLFPRQKFHFVEAQKFWKYSSVALLFAFFSKELTKSLWSLQAAAEQNTYPSPSLANYLSNFLKGNLIDALSKTTFFQGRSLICKMEFQSLGLTVI